MSWGATQITAADQAKLFLGIDTYVVPRHRKTARRLLASIVPYQRWGVAKVRLPGWALYFKSGWVSGIENQVSLLRRGDRRVAVAVLTSGLGSAAGRTVEREVARRLLRGLDRDAVPRQQEGHGIRFGGRATGSALAGTLGGLCPWYAWKKAPMGAGRHRTGAWARTSGEE